jgi:hypothetical protein
MLQDKITNNFNAHPELRVLFLFDEEGQFEDELAGLELGDIRFEKFENNFFNLKFKLFTEWSNEKVFLYLKICSPHKSGKFLEFPLSIGLYKENELMSNEAILELNSIFESPSERIHKLELVVNSNASNESFLKLKVFDIEEKLNPLIEIRVSNQTLIQPDF